MKWISYCLAQTILNGYYRFDDSSHEKLLAILAISFLLPRNMNYEQTLSPDYIKKKKKKAFKNTMQLPVMLQ